MNAEFLIPGFPAPSMHNWEPIVVKRADIEAHIERLAAESAPAHGMRAMRIVHPQASKPGQGLAPTIACTIYVLKPGEATAPMRHNASEVSLCIRGSGTATIGPRRFAFGQFDVWNTPAMHPYVYRNDSDALQVRLNYSNAALLETLGVHYVEYLHSGKSAAPVPANDHQAGTQAGSPASARILPAPIEMDGGAQLLTYEHLISPEVSPNESLLWRFEDVMANAKRVFAGDALKNKGRRGLFMLYNPATGRLLGATHSFFATIGFMPGDTLDFPHRHSSSAINYCIQGGHVSEVDGKRVIWDEGDIAYTAPGWSAHANGSQQGGIALTIQDHPLQMGTEALIWQEGEGKPIRLLGAEPGFVSDDTVELRSAG